MSHLKNPVDLAKYYYPPNFHFTPKNHHHSLSFFRDILFETKSISIKTINDPSDPSKILYHSLHIVKIITPDEWRDPPYTHHKFGSLSFNYHEYKDAWYNIFLYQKEDFSHSWFLNFDKYFYKKPENPNLFPMWFFEWWHIHGCPYNLLPDSLQQTVNCFMKVKQWTPYQMNFPPTLHFMAKFKIPWILKWQYTIIQEPPCTLGTVARQYLAKWWDKFEPDRVIGQFQKEFPVQHAPPITSSSPVKPALPTVTTSPPPVKESPTHEQITPVKTHSGSKAKGKRVARSTHSSPGLSYEEIKQLADQLLAQAVQVKEEEEAQNSSDSTSPTPSQSSSSGTRELTSSPKRPHNWYEQTLLEDSQDPFR